MENPILLTEFLNIQKKYFWEKGWKQGDLNPDNCIIYYINKNPKIKIFNFAHTEKYKKDINTIGYLKFLWNKEICLLYFIYANIMELDVKNNTWIQNGRVFKDIIGKKLCILLNLNDEIKIDIKLILNTIIEHLKYYIFCNNVLSEDYWKKE